MSSENQTEQNPGITNVCSAIRCGQRNKSHKYEVPVCTYLLVFTCSNNSDWFCQYFLKLEGAEFYSSNKRQAVCFDAVEVHA